MRKKLENLELEDFDTSPLWFDLFGDQDELEGLVESLDGVTQLSRNLEQHVWCRINVKLNDNSELKGIGMYFTDDGQLGNFSIKSGSNWMTLMLPPAPDFVLEKDGPIPFAQELNKNYKDVFPMTIETELTESSTGEKLKKIINV